MNLPIEKAVDQLPTGGLTVLVLRAIDSLSPSQWKNTELEGNRERGTGNS